MSSPNNQPIDPLILAKTFYVDQHEVTDPNTQALEAWGNPETLKRAGIDEDTARKIASGVTDELRPKTPGTTRYFSEIFPDGEVDTIRDMTHVAYAQTHLHDPVPKNYRPVRENVQPKTQEQMRIELGLNPPKTQHDANEQMVA